MQGKRTSSLFVEPINDSMVLVSTISNYFSKRSDMGYAQKIVQQICTLERLTGEDTTGAGITKGIT